MTLSHLIRAGVVWFTGRLEPERLEQFLDALRTIRDAVRPGATSGT